MTLQNLAHKKFLDIIIILVLMAISVGLRLPTINLPGMSYSDIAGATDDNGYPYLSDPDSYYYARRVRDYLAEDSILPRAIPDDARIAPSGTTSSFDFFSYFMSLILRFLNLFTEVSVEKFVVFASPFVYSLSIIPAYIFIRRRTNRFGAIFAGLLVGLNPAYFVDTNISCFDSDVILFVLPLSFICLFIEALEVSTRKSFLIYSGFSLFFFVLLFLSWFTADVYLYLLLAFFVALLIWKRVDCGRFRDALRDVTVRRSGLYILAATLMILICRGTIVSESIIVAASSILGLSESTTPSPAKFVSELSAPQLVASSDWYKLNSGTVISDAGGIIVCGIAILALIYLGSKAYKEKRFALFTLLFLWLAGTLLAASIANRFTKLLAIPVSLLAAYGLGLFYTYASTRHLAGTCIFFSCLLVGVPLLGVGLSCNGFHGSSSDTLTAVSRYIRDISEEDDSPLIVDWWDNGYIYQYESGVRTLMDGGTYNGHFYQNVAQALLDSDPASSVEKLKSFLAEIDAHPDVVYLPISRDYLKYSKSFEYYANFGLDDSPYHMDSALISRAKEEKDMGDYQYLTSFPPYYIYRVKL